MLILANDHHHNFYWTNLDWEQVFWLGQKYGWMPQGTQTTLSFINEIGEEDFYDWDGSYFTTANQWVTESDASSWANALDTALSHVPSDLCYPQQVIYAHSGFHTLDSLRATEEARRDQYDLLPNEALTIIWAKDFNPNEVPPTVVVVDKATEEDFYIPTEYYFSGKKKPRLREFIAFLHEGSFRILATPPNYVP